MRFPRKSARLLFALVILFAADPAEVPAQSSVAAAPKNKVQVETRADGLGTVLPAQSLTAGSSITVYAVERDPQNKYVANVAATWSLTSSTGGVIAGDLVASTDGKSAVFTGHVKGSAVIQALSGTLTVVPSGMITVVAGPATQVRVETAANGTGTLLPAQNLQSGRGLTVYAVSRDAYLNFVANVAATWSLINTTGGVVATDLVAGGDRKSAVMTGHKTGSAQISAVSGSLTAVPSGRVTVIPGTATLIRVETAPDGSGTIVPAQTIPTGKNLTVYAVTRDASQNFVANAAATWSLTGITGGIVQSDLAASGDKKSAVFTARAKGSAVIQATLSGHSTVPSGTITVITIVATQIRVETAPDGNGVLVPAQTLVAGRSITVYSIARDSANRFIGLQAADTWVLQNVTGGVVPGDLVPSADRTRAVFTARRTGTSRIRADYAALTPTPSGTITVATGAAAIIAAASGSNQGTTVGMPFKTALAAAVRDSFGNGLRNIPVNYSAPSTGPGGTFGGSSQTVLTDSLGIATAPPFTANTIAGRYADTARTPGITAPAIFELTNTADLPASITVRAGTPQSTPIITAYPVRLAVLVTDRHGNPVPGSTVTFVPPSAGPSGTFPGGGNTALTDTGGVATAPTLVANSVAGSFTLSASVTSVVAPALFHLTNLPGSPGSIVATSGNPQSTTVGTAFGLPLTVIVRDAASNPVRGTLVTFQAPQSGPGASFRGSRRDTVRTDSSGFAVSSSAVADSIAGSYSIVAAVQGVQPDAVFTLTNLPGALEHFAVEFADGDPSAVRYAGVPFNLQLLALDRYGNTAAEFSGSAEIASNLTLTAGGGTTPAFSNGRLGQHEVAVGSSGTGIFMAIRTGGFETGVSDSFAVHNPVPTVTAIDPPAGTAGYSLAVVLEGTGFLRGVTAVSFGDRIATTTVVESYRKISVTLQIDTGAAHGPRDVLITNKPPGGGTTTLLGTFTVEKNTYPATFELAGEFNFPSKTRPSDYTAADYRLVGIPGGCGWNLRDLLRGSPGTDWQAYWDNGQASDYLVRFDDGPQFTLTAGRAFWLVGRGGITLGGTVPTAPLDSGAVAIPLHPGWNLITNPLARTITWTDIQDANGGLSEMLFGFNGAFITSTEFSPYTGYYYFNGSGRQKLKVPYVPSGSMARRSAPQATGWRLAFDLRSPAAVDRTMALGVAEDASAGIDLYDQRRPRATGEIPTIEFHRPEWDTGYPAFATDIRRPNTELEVWRLRVVSKLRSPLSLAWRGSGELPAQLYLIDETRAAAVDLRADSVYRFTPAMDVSGFAVVAGSQEHANELLAGLIPREYSIGTNFPNPFNPSTTIPITLPEAADVRLAVYTILGEEVRALHDGPLTAGRHWMTWDGKGRAGQPVAAGLYLCRMEVHPGNVFVRKMLLLK